MSDFPKKGDVITKSIFKAKKDIKAYHDAEMTQLGAEILEGEEVEVLLCDEDWRPVHNDDPLPVAYMESIITFVRKGDIEYLRTERLKVS